jgi:hypothetical protein
MELSAAVDLLNRFHGHDLTTTLKRIEDNVRGLNSATCDKILSDYGVCGDALLAAGVLKRTLGQINMVIHALGILTSLPTILEKGETIEYVSLGAGNTGRKFDLKTNFRVAEFTFIWWQGGAETIRQNKLFKDFYHLAEYNTVKKKALYVIGRELPLKFF